MPTPPSPRTIETTAPIAFRGFCRECGEDHALGEGRAREFAEQMMAGFQRTNRLDYDRPDSQADPRLRGERLWEAEGRMFGALECRDAAGETVFLRAFSSLAGGVRWVSGWVPPLVDRSTRARDLLPAERRIKTLTRRLDRLDPHDPVRKELIDLRRNASRQMMADLHDLYLLRNIRGEERSVREAFAGPQGMPGGLGECCAPKLLTEAARQGLRPVGITEFFWGGLPPSENRTSGRFYAPCDSRCRPILGFLLCGVTATSPPLRVVHEDPEFVVVDKPGGFLAVPGRGPDKQECVARQVIDAYPGCIAQPSVHRLDMDTSGLMVFALREDSHRELSRQFREREPRKEYVALLEGVPEGDSGTIELKFRLDVDNRPIQILDDVHGKLGITHWEKLGVEGNLTRVRFRPITGRTHQLRLHASHPRGLGTPVLGDPFYGNGTGPGQLKLHATELAFSHPRTGEAVCFRSPPPF